GQNVNSYKGEYENGSGIADFTDLLYMINSIEGLERIRFMTSHPKDLSDKLIEAYAKCDKICKFLHLPVQSGSSEVLRRMNRKYSKEDYLALIDKLRAAVPGIALTTDIIVGFPGETEEDFAETIDLCKKVQYDSAFTFLYSIRKGTPAEKYDDQIPEEIKHKRFNELVEVINAASAAKNAEYVGKTERVLVEGLSKRDQGDKIEKPQPGMVNLSGRTDTFKLVNFAGTKDMIGNFVDVEIISSNTFSLVGRIKQRA
ncbi:MAG: MiaB/RimO family radical SAM methylthiotransferase, partial [Firmicutes bacterium]|nr:MiaB/RimO family radical SAM methylthiotransferase [Bacillota bacterium]